MGVKNHFQKSRPADKLIFALSLEINNPRTSFAHGSDPNFVGGACWCTQGLELGTQAPEGALDHLTVMLPLSKFRSTWYPVWEKNL